jgi:hypothetical protein
MLYFPARFRKCGSKTKSKRAIDLSMVRMQADVATSANLLLLQRNPAPGDAFYSHAI